MTVAQAVRLFHDKNPQTVASVRRLVSIRKIDRGRYRTVYKVKWLPLVVKIPRGRPIDVQHAQRDIERFQLLAGTNLQKHIPKLYWASTCSGIMLVEWVKVNNRANNRAQDALERKYKRVTKVQHSDLCYANWGKRGRTWVMLDLGWG